jgi:hypothetical protein
MNKNKGMVTEGASAMYPSSNSGNQNKRLSRENLRKFVDSSLAGQSSLPRQVDRAMFGHGEEVSLSPQTLGSQRAHQAVSEQFLSEISTDTDEEVQNWMDELKASSQAYLDTLDDELTKEAFRHKRYRLAIHHLVDSIFQNLRHFAFEFNKVANGTPLQISSSILGEIEEVVHYNKNREAESTVCYFRARLSNASYSLMIRGAGNLIEFYLLPTDLSMALSGGERNRPPVLTMKLRTRASNVEWMLLEESLLFDAREAKKQKRRQSSPQQLNTLEKVSMSVFAYFISISQQAESNQ